MDSFKNQTIIYKNGDYFANEAIGMDFSSQTIHFGYAAFDALRAYQTENGTKLFKARTHFERLKHSCELVFLPFHWDIDKLIADTYKLLEANQLKNAYVKCLVYTEPGIFMNEITETNLIITAVTYDSYYGENLIKASISSYEKSNPQSSPVNAKITGNYINSVLALAEARKRGFNEAILLDMYGYVTESSSSNIFIEKNGKLFTPKEGNIIPGITRNTVKQIAAQLEIEVVEKNLDVNDLKSADAAFLCGTLAEIVGVYSVDEVIFPTPFSESIGSNIQRIYKKIVLDQLSFEVII